MAGSDLSIGFEAFDPPDVEIYDPALNILTIAPGATSALGDVNWEAYGPIECAGTQTWTGVKQSAVTPNDLTGDWTVTVVELSDTCGPIDPTPVPVPVSLVQQGSLVDASSPVDFGQTRIIGRVSGQTLSLGLGLREAEGDFTVFDAAANSLTIAGNFASFTGTMTWVSYETLFCTGVNHWDVAVPEPHPGIARLAGLGALLLLRRRRRS